MGNLPRISSNGSGSCSSHVDTNKTRSLMRQEYLHCRKLSLVAVSILLVLAPSVSLAYPSGAPDQACKDMKPGHGAEPTSAPAPFELTQDKLQVGADEQIKGRFG